MREQLNTGASLANLTQSPDARQIFRTMERLIVDPTFSDEAEKDTASRCLYEEILNLPIDAPLITAIENMAEHRMEQRRLSSDGNVSSDEAQLMSDLGIILPSRRFDRNAGPANAQDEQAATSSELIGIIRTSVIAACHDIDSTFTDKDRTQASHWRKPLAQLNHVLATQPNSLAVTKFEANMYQRNIATNFPGRYMPLEMLLQVLGDRFPDGVRMADFGSSVGAGINWQLRKDELDQRYKMLMKFAHVAEFGNPRSDLTEKANEILDLLPILRDVVEIDIQSVYSPNKEINGQRGDMMYDPAFGEWARFSFRAKERHDPAFMDMFKELVRYKPDLVKFYMGNLLVEHHLKQFEELHASEEKFDVFNMSVSVHQNHPSTFMRLLNIANRLTHKDGLILVHEFGHLRYPGHEDAKEIPDLNTIDPKVLGTPMSLDRFETVDFWHIPQNFRSFAIDKAHPRGLGFQVAMVYDDNSRCTKPTVMPATFKLGKRVHKLPKLIRNTATYST
jgi:hypothetical protein